jgi:hypothetical protein
MLSSDPERRQVQVVSVWQTDIDADVCVDTEVHLEWNDSFEIQIALDGKSVAVQVAVPVDDE